MLCRMVPCLSAALLAEGGVGVVVAAVASECAGVLIDTWDKSGGRLVDLLSTEQLKTVRATTREAGLLLALAGRVSMEDLSEVAAIGPDLVAVRSAALPQPMQQSEACLRHPVTDGS